MGVIGVVDRYLGCGVAGTSGFTGCSCLGVALDLCQRGAGVDVEGAGVLCLSLESLVGGAVFVLPDPHYGPSYL